jgi:hypothetical protein
VSLRINASISARRVRASAAMFSRNARSSARVHLEVPGLPALGAGRDRHALGASFDLPFNDAEMTACLEKCIFHA